jgi:hypothetical protein
MPDINQNMVAKEYNNLIGKLPGVMNSSIVFSENDISEIHVLADTRRSPKQISRDIQTAIMVQYGVTIDHKLISIAQIPADNDIRLHNRLVIEEISLCKNKDHSTATVTVCDGDTSFSGTASSFNDSMEIYKMICHATLDAIRNFVDKGVMLSVADVKTYDLTGEKAIAVCIAVQSKDKVSRFLGSSFVGDDIGNAVVKATMDALNRTISNT